MSCSLLLLPVSGNSSDQLKVYLEENLRLKMSSEALKDELEAKRVELNNRSGEAMNRKGEVDALSARATSLDAAYRDKMNELRRFTDMTADLETGIKQTDTELSRVEENLAMKNEVAVRMKGKIDDLLVEIERVNAQSDSKARDLQAAKANAIALGSKHEALAAELAMKSSEANKWKVKPLSSSVLQCVLYEQSFLC